MTSAMHLHELGKVSTDRRNRGTDIRVVRRNDVIDQAIHRPVRCLVVSLLRRRERTKGERDGVWIGSGRPAGLGQRSPSAATEVDPELFEDTGGTEVGR